MTHSELKSLLYDTDHLGPKECLPKLGLALFSGAVMQEDDFWAASKIEQHLYALYCVIDHAGANGLTCVWDYHDGYGTGVVAAVVEALDLVGAEPLRSEAKRFWAVLTEEAKSRGLTIPSSFSNGTRADFAKLQDHIVAQEPWVFDSKASELSPSPPDDPFLSCWDTDFPAIAMKWLCSREAELAVALSAKSNTR
jgi:hypothetical protein